MGETGSEENIIRVGGETCAVDILGVSLCLQDDILTLPVPDGDGEVRETAERYELVTCLRELAMSVASLRAIGQDAVELHIRVGVDVDVGLHTLLSNSKELLAGVDGDRTDTISVASMDRRLLLCLQVVSLVLVATHENDDVRRQEVDVIALH